MRDGKSAPGGSWAGKGEAMTHPTDDELEALAIDLEEHAGWESEWQINITTKAASTIRKLKAERDEERVRSHREGYSQGKSAGDTFAKSIRQHVLKLEAEVLRLREALSLIAVVGYSSEPEVNAAIARQVVDSARAALKETDT